MSLRKREDIARFLKDKSISSNEEVVEQPGHHPSDEKIF